VLDLLLHKLSEILDNCSHRLFAVQTFQQHLRSLAVSREYDVAPLKRLFSLPEYLGDALLDALTEHLDLRLHFPAEDFD